MKKILTTAVFFILCLVGAHAQKGQITISPGLEIGLPIGDFGESSKLGLGLTGKGLYGINDMGDVTFTLGFIRFGMKNIDGADGVKASTSLIPILPGYRYKFSEKFYGEGQLGLTVVRSKMKISGLAGSIIGLGGFNSSSTNLGYAVGVGYLYDQFDFGLRYQGVSADDGSLSLIGIRAAYNIPL